MNVIAYIVPQTRAEWVEHIGASWRESFAAVIETGRRIQAARDALEHGEFLAMIAADLPFGARTAQMLMAVATDPRIANHGSHLPASWRTLYQITRLADEEFEAKLADGTINPEMKRSDLAEPKIAAPMSDAEAGEGEAERGPRAVDAAMVKDREDEAQLPNGARAIMASRAEPDDSLDYFPTPPWATRALMEHVLPALNQDFFNTAWEPACGEGHIVEVLREYFLGRIDASDINDYGYHTCGFQIANFLEASAGDVDWIITNPPFGDNGEKFAIHALDNARVGVAMFYRAQILEGVGRYERLFKPHPPTLVAHFVERVPLHKGRWDSEGDTATAYVWIVWLKNKPKAQTRLFWIPPGRREALTKEDDVERFTCSPVKAAPMRAAVEPPAEEPLRHVVEPVALDIPAFLDRRQSQEG